MDNLENTTSVQIADGGNITTWADKKGESENSTSSVLFYVFLVMMLICVAINARITYVVLVYSNPAIRSVRKLVVQFSTICICYSILSFHEYIGKIKIKRIATASTHVCQAFSYFRHVIYGLFPLNAATLVYERYTGPTTPFGQIVEYKFIAVIWLISAIVNIPEIFEVEYTIIANTKTQQCTQISIFGSSEATLAHEFIQFLIFHGLLCVYTAVCVYKIRLKLEIILKFERNRRIRMQRRALRLLFVFLTAMAFGILWLPTGILTLVYKTQKYYKQETSEGNSIMLAFTTFMQYILLSLTPSMYMLMNADLPPIFPGCQLYQGNILAERRGDWRRKASRGNKTTGESSDDIKLAILEMERAEMELYENRDTGGPVELREMPVVCDQPHRAHPLISPVCSIVEMEDYALVVRVKENPQTTLVLN